MGGFSDYDNYDALGLAELVSKGDVSSEELLDEAIERTERINPKINAVTQKHYDLAKQAIADGLPDGPLKGVPWLLKDLHLMLKGTATSSGSSLWKDQKYDYDSTLVARYKKAGLVIFGKTNTPELGGSAVTEPVIYGPTRNPWNLDRTPGGSSGGASAAVAAGIIPAANASDGGGSIRIPASCTGLVGLKPSRGRTPMGPVKSEGWGGQSISHAVSRTVRDNAALLDAATGIESGDIYTAPSQEGTFLSCVDRDPGKLKIAFSTQTMTGVPAQADAIKCVEETVKKLESLGHTLVETAPAYDKAALQHALITIIATNTGLAIKDRLSELGRDFKTGDVERVTEAMMRNAEQFSAIDYANAIATNHATARALGRFHEDYDVFLTATTNAPPVSIGSIDMNTDDMRSYAENVSLFASNTGIFNQTGQPAISVPLYWTDDGLPLGSQLSAAYGNDGLLLSLASQLEKAHPWWNRRASNSA